MGRGLRKFAWRLVAVLGVSGALCGMGAAADIAEDAAKNAAKNVAKNAAKDAPSAAEVSALDQGFSGLYNLDFEGAQKDFAGWQAQHPDDPMGRSVKRRDCSSRS